MNIKWIYSVCLFLFAMQIGNSQTKKSTNIDSTKIMYQKIESYSKKSKTRTFFHKLIFTSTKKKKPINNNFRKKINAEIEKNEGKIIRNIIIETLDPFGNSVEDETKTPNNTLEKFGNDLHIKTKKWTVRNQLLFKKNEKLDSYLIRESERLIRKQRFVRSVIIITNPIKKSVDSVDVYIRVLDSWSLVPNGSISSNRANFDITERNFFGLGHEFENEFGKQFNEGQKSYRGKYSINNIKNTFINTTFEYQNSFQNNITKSARIERVFFSPITKYAGGIFIENRTFLDSLPTVLPNFEKVNFEYDTKDLWLGYAFKIFKEKILDSRTTNFVTTFGYKNINYLKNASISIDPTQFLNDEELFLTSFGVTNRKFMQDKYLFNFDIIEDIPYGKVYAITAGFQNKNYKKRSYFGGRFSYGHYYNFGYLSSNLELGSFFDNGKTEETTIKIEANYFTTLLSLGNWKIRQFIKPSLVVGLNRDPIFKDRISLNNTNGLEGFTNPLFYGTRKFSVIFQTQTYAPGTWKGFHFSPFFNTSLGLLGNSSNEFLENKLYSKFTLGVLINNDYLVFNRFQISFSFYPTIPFEGRNIFKTNTLENNDFAIPDYTIGQPTIVNFN